MCSKAYLKNTNKLSTRLRAVRQLLRSQKFMKSFSIMRSSFRLRTRPQLSFLLLQMRLNSEATLTATTATLTTDRVATTITTTAVNKPGSSSSSSSRLVRINKQEVIRVAVSYVECMDTALVGVLSRWVFLRARNLQRATTRHRRLHGSLEPTWL